LLLFVVVKLHLSCFWISRMKWMRFEDGFDSEWREVLREPVSEAESRQLLDRLAVSEFGGSGESTLGDVCEASGATPLVIGRMLAEIRGKTWEQLFGQKLNALERKLRTHDDQLNDHGERISMIGDQLGVKIKSKRELEIEKEIRTLAENSISDRRNGYWGLLVALVVLFYVFVIMPGRTTAKSPDTAPPISRTSTGNR
jgi:hypothetical protein